MSGDKAKELYQLFVNKVGQEYSVDKVKDGVFQAMMVRTYKLYVRNNLSEQT